MKGPVRVAKAIIERKVQNEITSDVLDSFVKAIRSREYVTQFIGD